MNAIATIAAIATATGQSGIGIIRISGPRAIKVAQIVCQQQLKSTGIRYCKFYEEDLSIIDSGLALSFQAPNSYTGEEVVELHAHGNPIILNTLLRRLIQLGLRQAEPGEFSKRAFLNNKIDLTQAEAIADLIASNSEKAMRAAQRSMQGVFSQRVKAIGDKLLTLIAQITAAIDFSDQDIEPGSTDNHSRQIVAIADDLTTLIRATKSSLSFRQDIRIVFTGPPNAGKSSLLNLLCEEDRVIVSPIPGTTRDTIEKTIEVDGISITLVDTAGIHKSGDEIEQQAMIRSQKALKHADLILLVMDDCQFSPEKLEELWFSLPQENAKLLLRNKVDQSNGITGNHLTLLDKQKINALGVSAFSAASRDTILSAIMHTLQGQQHEPEFLARQRHLDELMITARQMWHAEKEIRHEMGLELALDCLHHAQKSLSKLTGQVTTEEILGEIFSSFCIGK